MTGADDPAFAGVPDMTHVVIDSDLQMQKYLADIAMEDILLSPPASARKERPDGLMAKYRKSAAAEHAIEAQNDRARVVDIEEIVVEEVSRTSVPSIPLPGALSPDGVIEVKKD